MRVRSFWLLILSLMTSFLLSACSPGESEQTQDLDAYKTRFGPHEVVTKEAVTLADPAQDGREVTFRVLFPKEEGTYPVIVYSSGAFCYPQKYDNVTEHWASHGYIVIVPNHMDSPNNEGPPNLSNPDLLMFSRVRDMSFALDAMADLEAAVKGLAGKPDLEHAAIAGHSFGAMITMVHSGILMTDPETGEARDYSDPRFDAALPMSGVSQMKQMAENAFGNASGPIFASGGTLDTGNVGDGNIYPWEWRMGGYRLVPPGDKFEVVLDQGDHYLGGMICRDNRGGTRDAEGVAIINGLSTAFLDAYLKSDADAKAFLLSANVDELTRGRAAYQWK